MNFRTNPFAATRRHGPAATLLIAAALTLGGTASAAPMLPQQQSEGAVHYRAGGLGQREARAMRQASGDYPLMLSFAQKLDGKDAYTANVDVRIAARDGGEVLDTTASGPLMLVDLPAGHYVITATREGRTLRREANIRADRTRRVYFEWGAT